MYNIWSVIFKAILSWLSVGGDAAGDQSGGSRCDQLMTVTPNFSLIVANSPYHAMWSSESSYNCTTVFMTGPGPTYGNNFTWILLRDYDMLASFSVTPSMSNETLFTTCKAGKQGEYRFLAFNPQYYIVFSCSKDGSTLKTVRGYGHYANNSVEMKSITDTYLKGVRGAESLYNTYNDCPFKPWCGGYFGLY